jgi:hypothetical protein
MVSAIAMAISIGRPGDDRDESIRSQWIIPVRLTVGET